jgi:hypothetical protein
MFCCLAAWQSSLTKSSRRSGGSNHHPLLQCDQHKILTWNRWTWFKTTRTWIGYTSDSFHRGTKYTKFFDPLPFPKLLSAAIRSLCCNGVLRNFRLSTDESVEQRPTASSNPLWKAAVLLLGCISSGDDFQGTKGMSESKPRPYAPK